jgi:hypothetical protein
MTTRSPTNFLDHFVAIVLGHVEREYPNKLDHVMNEACEVRSPRELHPVFFGSLDWHSCVHGYWLMVRALRLAPTLAQEGAIRELFDRRFTAANVGAEVEYLRQPLRGTFERTYGWAWLLKLGAELRLGAEKAAGDERGAAMARWGQTLEPLTRAFAEMYVKYLPKATYPIRVGTHNNSAFGLALALDYAEAAKHGALKDLIVTKANAWYAKDAGCPAWEPDGTDFLSPALMEAECVRRVLPAGEFVPWLDRFLPNLAKREPATLFTPAFVSDRTDGQITHLDGLNLSRAWCWRAIARALPAGDPRRALGENAAAIHLDAALPHVTGDYMGEHWLATFALLAMSE